MAEEAPRDVANEAEGLTITLPQRILSLLLRSATGEGMSSDCDPMAVVSETTQFMGEEFATRFSEATGEALPETLAAAHITLVTTLNELQSALPGALDNQDTRPLGAIGQTVSEKLTPAVSGFLSDLFDAVVAHEKASAKRMKDVDSSALSQIDELARTINFIAINASVEAARAGDAGKGFAVIATQIRELSQKSKDAVDQIRTEFS